MRETPKAAAAFTVYCELGPDRSLALLAEKLYAKRGQNLAQLKLWSAAHNWQERVAAYDAAQRDRERAQREAAEAERARRKLERDIRREAAREAMDDARAKVFGAEWAKVLKAINEKIDANDVKGLVGLTQLMARALDEERLSLGSATGKQQVDVTSNGQTVGQQMSLDQFTALQATLKEEMAAWRATRGFLSADDL